jgi:hypothetical protein
MFRRLQVAANSRAAKPMSFPLDVYQKITELKFIFDFCARLGPFIQNKILTSIDLSDMDHNYPQLCREW